MTTRRKFEHDPLGRAPCPGCDQEVYFAWDDAMVSVALEQDETGDVAVLVDGNRIPWCRPIGPGGQLALDESTYRLHEPGCTSPQAPVTDLAAERARRRRRRMHEGSRAHA